MKTANGEESTDIVEMDAMDVVEWEREQHTPIAPDSNLAALVKKSAEDADGAPKPRATRNAIAVPLGDKPAGELPRATGPSKLIADAEASSAGGTRAPNPTIPTPAPLMQQLLKTPTKNTTQRTPRLASATVPTPAPLQQTLVRTEQAASVVGPLPTAPVAVAPAPAPASSDPAAIDETANWGDLDEAWDEAPKASSTKSDAQAYSAPTTPRVTTSNTVKRIDVPRKTGEQAAATPPVTPPPRPPMAKSVTRTQALPTVAAPVDPNAPKRFAHTKPTTQQHAVARPVTEQQPAIAKPNGAKQTQPLTKTNGTPTANIQPLAKPNGALKPTAESKPVETKPANGAAKPTSEIKPLAAKPIESKPVIAPKPIESKPAIATPTPVAPKPTAESKPVVAKPTAESTPERPASEAPIRASEPALLPPPPTPAMQMPIAAPYRNDDGWDGMSPRPSTPKPAVSTRPLQNDFSEYDDDGEPREPSVIIDLNAKPVDPSNLDWTASPPTRAPERVKTNPAIQLPIQTSELNSTASGVFVMPTAAAPNGASIAIKPEKGPDWVESFTSSEAKPPEDDDDLAVPLEKKVAPAPAKISAATARTQLVKSEPVRAPPPARTSAKMDVQPVPSIAPTTRTPTPPPASNPPTPSAPPPPALPPPPAFPSPPAPTYPTAETASNNWPQAVAKQPGVAFSFTPATQQSAPLPRAPSAAEMGWERDPAIPQQLEHAEATERRFVPPAKSKRTVLLLGGAGAAIVLLLVIVLSSGGKSSTPDTKPVAETPKVEPPPTPPTPEPVKVETPPVVAAVDTPTPPSVTDTPTPPVADPKPAKPFVRRASRPAKPLVLDYDKPKADPAPASPTPDQALARARAAYATGNQHLFAGEDVAAIASYREALAVYPGYVAGYRGLGLAYALHGDRDAALKAFKTYVGLVPNAKDVALIQKRIARLSGQ